MHHDKGATCSFDRKRQRNYHGSLSGLGLATRMLQHAIEGPGTIPVDLSDESMHAARRVHNTPTLLSAKYLGTWDPQHGCGLSIRTAIDQTAIDYNGRVLG